MVQSLGFISSSLADGNSFLGIAQSPLTWAIAGKGNNAFLNVSTLIRKPQDIRVDNILLLGITKLCTCTTANSIDMHAGNKDKCG